MTESPHSFGVGAGASFALVGISCPSFSADFDLERSQRSAERTIYENWIDEFAAAGPVLKDLANQDRNFVEFYDASNRLVVLVLVKNTLGGLALHALSRITVLPAWTTAQYAQARESFQRRYPQLNDRWNALSAH